VPANLYKKNPTIADIVFCSAWIAICFLMILVIMLAECSSTVSIIQWGWKMVLSIIPVAFVLAGLRIILTHTLDFDNSHICYIKRIACLRIREKDIPLNAVTAIEILRTNANVFGAKGGLRYNLLIRCEDQRNILIRCEERRLDVVEAVRSKIEGLLPGQKR